MDTGFIATTIKRICRKKLYQYLFFLVGIFLSTSCFLVFLWLLQQIDLGFYLTIIVGSLITCAILARSVFILIHALQKPLESYFVSDLKRYGPLQQTITQIDSEAAPYLGKTGSFVTQHWIVSALSNSISFIRIEDVVWIYKQLSENSVRFYYALTVPLGKTYAAQILNRSGSRTTIASSEKGINDLLEAIAKNAPWVTKGYMDYLAAAWASNRSDFVAAVDQRHEQMLFLGDVPDSINSNEVKVEKVKTNQPIPEPPPISASRPFEYDLNHPLVQAGIAESVKKEHRSIRGKGLLLLFGGFGGSIIFILPLIYGVLENKSGFSISNNGIVLSLTCLMFGIYNTAFGLKGKKFYEKIIGKNWWTLIFSFLLMAAFVILLSYVIDFIVKIFGYQVTNSFTP